MKKVENEKQKLMKELEVEHKMVNDLQNQLQKILEKGHTNEERLKKIEREIGKNEIEKQEIVEKLLRYIYFF